MSWLTSIFAPRAQPSPTSSEPEVMIEDSRGSCPQDPAPDTCKRTEFGRQGCTAFAYPSEGGVLIKEVDVVDMRFLGLNRSAPSRRSENELEENQFCEQMRRLGATWWNDEQEYIDTLLGVRQRTEVEATRLVFGWPQDGQGVWMLRYETERDIPRDFGKIHLAVDMNERCQVMKEYGATFYKNPGEIDDLTTLES